MSTSTLNAGSTRRRAVVTRPAGRSATGSARPSIARVSVVARRAPGVPCGPMPAVPSPRIVTAGAGPAPVLRRAVVHPPVRRTAPSGSVRLTRRGRLVLVVALLLVLLTALTAFGARSAATGERGVPVQTQTVEVGAGDTLWAIAARVAAPGEVRDTVHKIEELNALNGPALTVGQTIAVPVQ